ncbi:glycosyltransferase [Sanyastnella coralliicola]|uniref:glycosyltransferase n=1 Tax=Sanyastnella coralliicola TaxID=3069118 RepID=UPI0027BACC47|nr:glycosyltransferase [Longitalea sp. SCSIO 12813]
MEEILHWWNEQSGFQQALGITFLAMVLIQLLYDLTIFIRLSLWRDRLTPTRIPPISIVICAKNEEKNLRDLVPLLMEQDHPDFELIIVDDSSWDDTLTTLNAYQVRYPKLHVVALNEDIQRMRGKKFALTMGIKAAKNDIVLLTDADCIPDSKSWAQKMALPFTNQDVEVVLGFSPYATHSGFLNKVIRFDTVQIAIQYLSYALVGAPYMGVGRNMAYRTATFFDNSGFKNHMHLASGDDDLFISEVAKKKNTHVTLDPDTFVLSEPKSTWQSWFHQKRRHFTTATEYKFGIKIILGLWPLSFMLMWVTAVLLAVLHSELLIVGSLLTLRYIVHLATFRGSFVKTKQKDLTILMPVLEGALWIINPALWLWNLLSKPRTWK